MELPAHRLNNGIAQQQSAQVELAGGLHLVMVGVQARLNHALPREEEQTFEVVRNLGVEGEEVDVGDEIRPNGFGEEDAVDLPDIPGGKRNPLNTLIRGVINSLLNVEIFEIEADCFYLDDHLEFPFDTGSEVAVRPADAEIPGNFAVFVVPKEVGHNIRDDHRGVGLVHVADLSCGQE